MDISITTEALTRLRHVADEDGVNLDETMLRIAVIPGGCSGLTYDLGWDTTVQETDEVDVVGGLKVVLDPRSAVYLEDSELHFTDGLEGDGFHFSNPQAERTCACGESFGM
jgi:iron-sulfur cluster assembly protein